MAAHLPRIMIVSISAIPYFADVNTTVRVSPRGTQTRRRPRCRMLGFDKGGVAVAETTKGGIVLKPSVTFPIEIYSDARIAEFDAADAELARHLKRKRK